MHVPSSPIETHSDDNIVGNWRLHSRHSIHSHTATNVMENINLNVPKVIFMAYNVTATLSELFFLIRHRHLSLSY